MSEVFVIKQKTSIVLSSISDYLRSRGYRINDVRGEVTDVRSAYIKDNDCVIVYAENKLALHTEALIAIKDKIIETKALLVIIEGDEGYSDVKEFFPDDMIALKFMHPLDAKTIGPEIARRMEIKRTHVAHKVMVVDDSAVMLTLAKSWLEEKYQVTCASSGAMAFKYLSLDRPDLILLDYEMPIVSGKILFEMLRAEPDFSSIPVIFLTGQNDKKTIMEVLELKPEGYLLKSMEPGEIIKAVDDYFAKHDFES